MSKLAKIFGFGGAEKPPPLPTLKPLTPLPKREDKTIEETRKRQLSADKLRKGRTASILTSGRGVEEQLGSVSRPRAATLLGG